MALDFQDSLRELYTIYNGVIKPLIADYEAREEMFPTPIFNEIRAFNDHIAQCYRPEITNEKLEDEIKLAKRHIYRIVLDCYKYLDVALYKRIAKFEKETKRVDLTIIQNGLFYPEYRRLNQTAVDAVRSAKSVESLDRDLALERYQIAYNQYCQIEELINSILQDVKWAKRRMTAKRILKYFLWFLAAVISGMLSLLISCGSIWGIFDKSP